MKNGQMITTLFPPKTSAALLNSSSGRVTVPKPASSDVRPASKAKGRIKLLLVDDHPIVRKGIGSCLAKHSNLDVIGEASDGREGLAKAREMRPDVMLMDIDMPHMSGLSVAEVLRKELPQIKVIILSMHRQPEYVLRILQSGAQGYVLKDAPPEELVTAINTVMTGEAYFSPDIARVALNQFVQGNGEGPAPTDLTQREREVLVHIAEGCSNKEIATNLGVGVRTVETHRERIMRKLNIHSIAGLTRFAIAKGMVTLREDIRR
jgi:DNA-binding NarL/FixJ family response regulator